MNGLFGMSRKRDGDAPQPGSSTPISGGEQWSLSWKLTSLPDLGARVRLISVDATTRSDAINNLEMLITTAGFQMTPRLREFLDRKLTPPLSMNESELQDLYTAAGGVVSVTLTALYQGPPCLAIRFTPDSKPGDRGEEARQFSILRTAANDFSARVEFPLKRAMGSQAAKVAEGYLQACGLGNLATASYESGLGSPAIRFVRPASFGSKFVDVHYEELAQR